MTRPLRIEFAGAIYHVTSRGNGREDIYLDDVDRQKWLEIFALVCKRFNWVVHAYCQMTNHYHLLIETVDGNLAGGMRHLNGVYTQRFNQRHKEVGHLFQGRYKAILVQKEAHLLELARYIVLNPVRAGMVKAPEHWPWSSYSAVIEDKLSSPWLDTNWILTQFGTQRSLACRAYQRFVMEGIGQESPLEAARNQLFLGDDDFIVRHRSNLSSEEVVDISKAHRRSLALTLPEYQTSYKDRDKAMAQAYRSGAYTMAHIADHFGVHYMTVSRAVKSFEDEKSEKKSKPKI